MDTSGTVGRCPEPLRFVGRAACEPVEDAPASVADIVDELAACVTPNPADDEDEEELDATVTSFVELDLALLVDVVLAELTWREATDDTGFPVPSPIAKSPDVAYITDMLFKATAWSVYPSPMGTTPNEIVLVPS